jgi:uncharacterized membrane protein
MSTDRVNAFSDGVIAILLTIMVLELRVPHTTDLSALRELIPVFLTYVLSFILIGIYWNNHHHMLHLTDRITGGILWANLHLLFWLSLMPFATAWMGENHNAPLPTAMMGFVLLMCALGWGVLQSAIVGAQGPGSKVLAAVGRDRKSKLSGLLYIIAIPLAFVNEWISDALYVVVALIWFVPDRRFAAVARAEHENHRS